VLVLQQDSGAPLAPALPETAEGLPLRPKADKLWFLHAAAWAPADPDKEIARYVIRYEDGTQETVPLRYESEVGDWYWPKPLPGCRAGWTGSVCLGRRGRRPGWASAGRAA